MILAVILLTGMESGTADGIPSAKLGEAPASTVAPDAKWYAGHYGVSTGQATIEMDLADAAGLLEAELSERETEAFAGLWIARTPRYSVQVRMLPGTEDRVWRYVDDPDLAAVLAVDSRDVTVENLRRAEERVADLLPKGEDALLGIDVERGVVDALVTPTGYAALAEATLPENVDVSVDDLNIQPASSIYGGLALSNGCTSGFSVHEDGAGTESGISTAAHCTDTVTYLSTNLPLRQQRLVGSSDIQWHFTPGIADPAQFYSGIDTRDVVTVWSRTEQVVGDAICKYGRNTGYTCMELRSKDIDALGCLPTAGEHTWMLGCDWNGSDCRENVDLVGGGDSGGPVFKNNGARGTTSCFISTGSHNWGLIYMASNYFHSVDVHIKHV